MVYRKIVEPGRVVFLARGRGQQKIATVLNIVDQNRVIVDGPATGRQLARLKNLELTNFVVDNISHQSNREAVQKAWTAAEIDSKWSASKKFKKLERTKLRRAMTDFDRFKLKRATATRNRIVKLEMGRLKRLQKKKPVKLTAAKPPPASKAPPAGASKPAGKPEKAAKQEKAKPAGKK